MPDSGEALYQVVRGVSLAAALLIGIGLERWRPHERLHPAWGTNLGLCAVDAAVMAIACGACGWFVAEWATDRGLGLLAWLDAGPWVCLAAGLLGLDAVSYFWHRANHQIPFLWRFHRVHHADTSFHVTTALRFHPGELLLALPVRLAAILALGVPPQGVLVFEVVFGVANLLEHGNFDFPRGLDRALQRVFVTPSLHRAHHVSDWTDLNTNFGTVFAIWDRLGRTLRPSDPETRVSTGLPGRRDAPALLQSLLLPFAARAGWGRAG